MIQEDNWAIILYYKQTEEHLTRRHRRVLVFPDFRPPTNRADTICPIFDASGLGSYQRVSAVPKWPLSSITACRLFFVACSLNGTP